MRAILALTTALALATCSGANGETDPEEPLEQRAQVEEVAPPQPAEPRPELDPNTACGRALACCRAYCAAIPNAVEDSACAGVYEALDAPDPDARCRAMCDGWRQALERLREGETPLPECVSPPPS